MSDTHVFPQPVPLNDEQRIVLLQGDGGLTKRELFAAMAMQAIMEAHIRHPIPFSAPWFHHLAEQSVTCADALLAELEKKWGEV